MRRPTAAKPLCTIWSADRNIPCRKLSIGLWSMVPIRRLGILSRKRQSSRERIGHGRDCAQVRLSGMGNAAGNPRIRFYPHWPPLAEAGDQTLNQPLPIVAVSDFDAVPTAAGALYAFFAHFAVPVPDKLRHPTIYRQSGRKVSRKKPKRLRWTLVSPRVASKLPTLRCRWRDVMSINATESNSGNSADWVQRKSLSSTERYTGYRSGWWGDRKLHARRSRRLRTLGGDG